MFTTNVKDETGYEMKPDTTTDQTIISFIEGLSDIPFVLTNTS